MRYVLDANAAIAALNEVGAVRTRLEGVPGSEVGIPVVAVGELLFGAHKSRRREENLDLGAILVTSDQALLDGSIGELRAEDWMS